MSRKLSKPLLRRAPLVLALAALLPIAGCITLPQTRQADLPLPEAWPAGQTAARIAPDWWTAFHDPVLDQLMAEALAHNDDLKLAAARILEARANLGLARADQYPEAEVSADVSRTRRTERGAVPMPGSPINDTWNVTASAAYELDLWGRYRQATTAARADLLATRYAQEVVRQTLTHDLASGYFALRALEAQARLSRDTRDNRRQAVELQGLRAQGGVASELELRQAQAELAGSEGDLARLEQQMRQGENALAVLLGRSPRDLMQGAIIPGKPLAELDQPPAVPTGLPSDLLRQRPDLRQAEAQLAAAQARIAEARAAIYPDLKLTAYLGSESKALSDLFSGPATLWGLTAGLVQTVFNAGRTEAAVQAASARQEQTLIGYEKSVRLAFREVLDALVAHRQAREVAQAETTRAEALARAAELADLRHRNGVAGYLEVLDARRNLYQAEQARIEARRSQLVAVASLSKALGGGWEAGTP